MTRTAATVTVQSIHTGTRGRVLRDIDGWMTILWDGSTHGPIDYHQPVERGLVLIVG